MDNLENKVGGVRLSIRDFKDPRDYAILMEAMREASLAKMSLAEYDFRTCTEVRGNPAPYVITKLALLRNARRIAEGFEGITFNPKDEGLYRPHTADDYSNHGQGD